MHQLKEQTTMSVFNAYEYERGLGQANPVWQPVPEYYYPLDCKQTTLYVIYVVGTILMALGIFIGFLFWCVSDLAQYVLIWTIIFCILLVFAIYFLYAGGKDRRRQEKQLIQQTNRKQQELINQKK